MEPEHHNKIMVFIGIVLVVVAVVIAAYVIRGRVPSLSSPEIFNRPSGYNMQELLKSATATGSSTVTNLELQKLKRAATVATGKAGSGNVDPAELQKYINSASAQ